MSAASHQALGIAIVIFDGVRTGSFPVHHAGSPVPSE